MTKNPIRALTALATWLVLALSLWTGTAVAIVNGHPAHPGEHPYLVALTSRDGEQFCGGAIVGADLIVTAEHCLAGESVDSVRVLAGATSLNDASGQRRDVADIRAHADGEINDIAMLRLAEPLTFGPTVQPIAVVDPAARPGLVDDGSPATVMGWGARSEDDETVVHDVLTARVQLVGDAECRAMHDPDLVPAVMVCADSSIGSDSCYGDSGGPLVVTDPITEFDLLLGVTSYGTADCGEGAGVYSELPAFAEFVANGGEGGLPAAGSAEEEDWPEEDWTDEDWTDEDWTDEDWTDEWDDQHWYWDDGDWNDTCGEWD